VEQVVVLAAAIELEPAGLQGADFAQRLVGQRAITGRLGLADVELLGADLLVDPVALEREQALLDGLAQADPRRRAADRRSANSVRTTPARVGSSVGEGPIEARGAARQRAPDLARRRGHELDRLESPGRVAQVGPQQQQPEQAELGRLEQRATASGSSASGWTARPRG
jgi:hypothetical protein